jgi:hypothetical protein
MALAILRSSRIPAGSGAAFDVEIGSNRFYQYAIGDATVGSDRGFPMLGAPSFTSPLVGPLPLDARGRARLEIPAERFDREHRYVQLKSFRDREGEGPAVSDIVKVAVVSHGGADFPPIAFGLSHDMKTANAVHTSRRASWQRPVAMEYREVATLSHGLFLDKLVPLLGGLAKKVLPTLGALLTQDKKGETGATNGAGTANGAGSANGTDSAGGGGLITFLTDLIGKGGGSGASNGGGASDAGNAGTAGDAASGNGSATRETPPTAPTPDTVQLILQFIQQLKDAAKKAPAGDATAAALSRAYASPEEYSRAAVAPALLAALPALIPLLEKVLTPETIKSILEHTDPTRWVGAVTDGIKEIGKVGLDFDKQSNEHLRALNPMGVHAPVDDLLKSMGFASAMGAGVVRERGEPAYRRVESVRIDFAAVSPVTINGRSRVCYRAGRDIAFAIGVKTPRPILDGVLTLLVKDPATRKILVRSSAKFSQRESGGAPVRLALSAGETSVLSAGQEYLACAYLTWKNARGKRIGTSRSQLITLVGEYAFDRVEEGRVLPLNDVAKFRSFWHRIWQGAFNESIAKTELEGKYYVILEPDREDNAPIATETKIVETNRGARAQLVRLRSGMTMGLGALNALIPQISTGRPLPEAQLAALRSSEFVKRVQTVGRFSAGLTGRPRIGGALWVYPEVKLSRVVLLKAATIDPEGHVRELTEEPVVFPIPAVMHVIGARTTI